MLIRRPDDVPSSEITPESVYLRRREFIARLGGAGATLAGLSLLGAAGCRDDDARTAYAAGGEVATEAQEDKLTPYEDVTSYNNYYEFGTDKSDPMRTRTGKVVYGGVTMGKAPASTFTR